MINTGQSNGGRMHWVRRAVIALAMIVALGSAGIGAAGLWMDGKFDDARPSDAVVALSEDARLDVEVPREADDGTFIRAIVWSERADLGIGDRVSVQLVDSPKGWARIVGDERLDSYGRARDRGSGSGPVDDCCCGSCRAPAKAETSSGRD